jgi:hypothetical protein
VPHASAPPTPLNRKAQPSQQVEELICFAGPDSYKAIVVFCVEHL